MDITLPFDNRFARLPPVFYTKMDAEGFPENPYLIHANRDAAALIGLDPAFFTHPDFPDYFAGNLNLPGAEPLSMVYAGHQFGTYVPQLGDGRALLLGQVRNSAGELWDIQLKGSGVTPYSRFGDGRAVLRSCIREYLCGEALHALSIPTTRALCIVGTGETVIREAKEPGAILTRLARSHIRFGSFEYFHHTNQPDAVRQLADHVIEEYFPEHKDKPDRYTLWYRDVVLRTACLIAQWQSVGFAHGVMNTDNMSILGLTIDYGPFGFVEAFDPGFICNHSDESGRYALNQQPNIALWNLYALAHALQPLFPLDAAKESLTEFSATIVSTYESLMTQKLGLLDPGPEDNALWQKLLYLMQAHAADYTLTFRDLSGDGDAWLARHFNNDEEAKAWRLSWQDRVSGTADLCQRMNAVNPKFVLRNWVAEIAIRAAEDRQDYSILDRILTILKSPYDEHPDAADYAAPAPQELAKLCVSCSS